METTSTKNMTFIILGGILLAAIIIAVVLFVLPRLTSIELATQLDTGEIALENNGPSQFNVSVLERNEYKQLDLSLFVRGLLPVTPPTGTGKRNLFQ